jgi:glutamate 5-kinase
MDREEIFKSSRRIVIKVGSGVLTTKNGLDRARVELLAWQIARLAREGRQVVLVSSGAVACGRAKAGLDKRPRKLPELQAAAALGQAGLMQAYEDAFGHHGREVAQILLTAGDLCFRRRYTNVKNTFSTLLDWDVIPIVNENDTVSPAELRFGDNDNLAAMLTNLLGAELFINLTNVDGVQDSDPRTDPDAKRIKVVKKVEPELIQACSGQPNTMGMGGILSKVRAADKASRCGAHTIVANGRVDDILDRLSQGQDLGTLFLPRPRPSQLKSRKHWIAFTAIQDGDVVVDEGAVRPLTVGHKSLLAVGIREVRGEFPAGGTLKVLGPGETILGVGISNYSSEDLARIKGMHSNELKAELGSAARRKDEVINRDNMVIFGLDEEESVACLLNN